MTVFKKGISLVLACLLALSAVSCAKNGEEETDTTAAESAGTGATETATETETTCQVKKTNYNGEINVVTPEQFFRDYCFPSEQDASGMNPELHERALKIKDHIGVEFVLQEAGDWITYSQNVTKTVQAGDDAYQMVLTPVYRGIAEMITSNVLYDFHDLPTLDLNAEYWNRDLMESMEIGGHMYLGYNDFMLSLVNLITFNKKMMEENQMEAPYEHVRNKTWTLDQMISMASQVAVDDGDNKWTNKDTYGVTGWGWVPLIDFVTSSDQKIVNRDENGQYYVAYQDDAEKMGAVVEKVYEMYTADYSFFAKSVYKPGDLIPIESGRALFTFHSSSELTTKRDVEVEFGILPYPKFDESQEEYHSLSWNGMMCVPNTIRCADMVSDAIELLAYYADPVKVAFYETLLGMKLADAPDDAAMLDVIWKGQSSDVGLVMCMADVESLEPLLYMIPRMCESGNPNMTSFVKRYKKSADRALKKLFNPEV